MILVKDLIRILRRDIVVIIDEGSDSYNYCRLHPYYEKEDSNREIEEIFFIEEKSIGVKVL